MPWYRQLLGNGRIRASELTAIAARASAIASGSERPFLDLGNALRLIHERTAALREVAQASLQTLEAEAAQTWIPQLRAEVKSLEGQLSHANGQLKSIHSAVAAASEGFEGTRTSLREVAGSVLKLRMLALLTRIESAHLSGNAQGIRQVAEEVERQANGISQRTDLFVEQSDALIAGMHQMETRLRTIGQNQGANGAHAVEQVASALDAVFRFQETCHRQVATSLQQSKEIVSNTGEVVASLQFHDITRQRLEHIADAIQAAQATAKGTQGGVAFLQAAQAAQARDDLRDASHGVLAGMEGIAAACRVLAGGVGELGAETQARQPESGGSIERQLELAVPALALVHTSTREIEGELRTLSASLAQFADLHTELAQLASEVAAITTATKRIGMNAAIKAHMFGGQGAPLAALAQEVQALATDVAAHSASVRTLVAHMDQSAHLMREIAARTNVAAPGTNGGAPGDLTTLLNAVRKALDEQATQRNHLALESRDLAQSIDGAAERFRKEQTLVADLGGLHEALLGFTQRNGAGTDPAAFARELAAPAYTMERERTVYRQLAGGGRTPERLPSSGAVKQSSHDALRPKGGEDLGENVELF